MGKLLALRSTSHYRMGKYGLICCEGKTQDAKVDTGKIVISIVVILPLCVVVGGLSLLLGV